MGAGATTNKNEYIFRDMPVYKAIWAFALPTIVSQLVLLAYNLADTYFLGRTGNPYMVAAASLMLPVYNVCVAIADLFGVGGGTLVARLLGSRDPEEAKKVSGFSVVMSAVSALIFSLTIFVFQEEILYFLGASPNTITYAMQYSTFVLILGAVPTVLAISMANMARNAGLSREAGIGNSCAGLLNIILDPLFMFVLFPEGREVAGAAVATLISNVCNVIYFIIIFRLNKNKSVLRLLPTCGVPRFGSFREIIMVGIPSCLAGFFYDLTNIVIDKLSSTHGDIPLAAIGIVLKAERLPLNICIGLCLGMVPLVGYNFASGDHERMEKVFGTTRIYGFSIAFACIILYELFADTVVGAFISDAGTVALGTGYLRVRCLASFMMFACFQVTFFFQGVGRGTYSLALAAVRHLVFDIPILFLSNSLFGMAGIIWSQLTADTFAAAISLIVYRNEAKKGWIKK